MIADQTQSLFTVAMIQIREDKHCNVGYGYKNTERYNKLDDVIYESGVRIGPNEVNKQYCNCSPKPSSRKKLIVSLHGHPRYRGYSYKHNQKQNLKKHDLIPLNTIHDSKEMLTSGVKGYTIASGARTSSWRKPHDLSGYNYARLLAGVPVIKHPQGKYRGLTNSGSSSRLQAVLEAVREVFFNAKLEALMTAFKVVSVSEVASSLGFENSQEIYDIIFSHIDEFDVLGDVLISKPSDEKTEEIFLNTQQVQLLTVLSPGTMAALFRHQLIKNLDRVGGKHV